MRNLSKKAVVFVVAMACAFASVSAYANSMTLYALDGRTAVVEMADVDAWLKVGWYTAPVQQLYTEDGRTDVFVKTQVPAQLTVGWYTEPVQRLYTEDGRTDVFAKSRVSAQLTVGWYTEPVQRLYAEDGRSQVFAKWQVPAQLTVGWYTTPQLDTGYKKAYADILKGVLASGDYYYDKGFSLCYIDGDNIPELVYYVDSCHAAGAVIYTYRNSNAVKLTQYSPYTESWWDSFGEFGGILYLERANVFTSQYWGMGYEHVTFYKISEGKAVQICELSGSDDYNEYKVNGENVSRYTYMKTRKEYGLTGDFYTTKGYLNSTDKNHYELTYTNIRNILEM